MTVGLHNKQCATANAYRALSAFTHRLLKALLSLPAMLFPPNRLRHIGLAK